MQNTQQPELMTYDFDVPSKVYITNMLRVGTASILLGVAAVFGLIWWFFTSRMGYYSYELESYYEYDQFNNLVLKSGPTGWHWLIPLALIIAGCVLRSIFLKKRFRYHEFVRQGVIIQKDNFGGWLLEGIQWTVTIKGYTYGNTLRYYRHDVPAGDWQKYENGQVVDFRE